MYPIQASGGRRYGLKMVCLITVFTAYALIFNGCSKKGEKTPAGAPQGSATALNAGKEHFEKGVQLSLKRQYDDAIKEYEESLKINPKSPEAYNNLGFAYYDKGDFDKAVDNQKKALELNPNLENAYYGLAQALEKKGDKAGALNNWKEFMKRSEPHSKWWMQAQAHIKNLEQTKTKGKANAKDKR